MVSYAKHLGSGQASRHIWHISPPWGYLCQEALLHQPPLAKSPCERRIWQKEMTGSLFVRRTELELQRI